MIVCVESFGVVEREREREREREYSATNFRLSFSFSVINYMYITLASIFFLLPHFFIFDVDLLHLILFLQRLEFLFNH